MTVKLKTTFTKQQHATGSSGGAGAKGGSAAHMKVDLYDVGAR